MTMNETAWLIEVPEAGDRYESGKRVGPARPVEWLAGIPWGERWKSRTNDPNKAIRFARKADAEAAMLIMQLAGTAAFASEHIWHSLRQPAPRADDALREACVKAETWFRVYAAQHRAKRTPEGNMKADTNEERADYLRAALASEELTDAAKGD